jgi:hypothetical protein
VVLRTVLRMFRPRNLTDEPPNQLSGWRLRYAPIVGRLGARLGTPRSTANVGHESALGQRIWLDESVRAFFLEPSKQSDAPEVARWLGDPDLGPAAEGWLLWRSHRPDAALATVIFQIMSEPVVSGRTKLEFALRIAPHLATSYSDIQARAILDFALIRSAQPIDPYDPDQLVSISRTAVVGLLTNRPELNDVLTRRIAERSRGVASLPVEGELAATASRNRSDGTAMLPELVTAWEPSRPDQVLELARLIDRQQGQVGSSDQASSGFDHAAAVIRRDGQMAAMIGCGPLCAGVVARISYLHSWPNQSVSISLSDAVAAVAVLATVYVFSVQLPAARLTGPVARVAGRPPLLIASFSAATTLLVLTVVSPTSHQLQNAVAWARLAMTILFLMSLLVALFAIARRIDPSIATRAYVSFTLPTHQRTGRKLGKLQGRAVGIRAEMGDLTGIDFLIAPEDVGRRFVLHARRRGFLLPNSRRLRRLLQEEGFQAGRIKLRISAGFGTTIDRGQEMASLVPDGASNVPSRVRVRTRRTLTLRRIWQGDETAAASVALVALALERAGAQDLSTATNVAREAAALLSEHVLSARRSRRAELERATKNAAQSEPNVLREGIASSAARRRSRDEEPAPVVPALKAALRVAIDQRVSKREDVGDIPELIVEALVAVADRAESGPSMIMGSIPSAWSDITGKPFHISRMLFLCGRKALETADSPALALLRQKVKALVPGDPSGYLMRDLASELTALTCWLMPEAAAQFVLWFDEMTRVAVGTVDVGRNLCLFRIGSAALAAAMPSIAFSCVSAVKETGSDLIALRELMMRDEVRSNEELRSNLNGRYLGDSPSDALASFFTFAEQLLTFA